MKLFRYTHKGETSQPNSTPNIRISKRMNDETISYSIHLRETGYFSCGEHIQNEHIKLKLKTHGMIITADSNRKQIRRTFLYVFLFCCLRDSSLSF